MLQLLNPAIGVPRPPEKTCKQMSMAVVLACWGRYTKYEGLGDFSNRSGFLIVLQAEKSKFKVLADSVWVRLECVLLFKNNKNAMKGKLRDLLIYTY